MKIAGQVERVQIEKGILFISDNHFSLALLFDDYFLYIGTSAIYTSRNILTYFAVATAYIFIFSYY